MSKTIEEVLDYGYIIAADGELDCLITWNGHLTFLFWIEKQAGWENTDIMTVTDKPSSIDLAQKIAADWLNEIVNEDYEGNE